MERHASGRCGLAVLVLLTLVSLGTACSASNQRGAPVGDGTATPSSSSASAAPSPAGTVTSPDGHAQLNVPNGALPAGVNFQDLKVTRLSASELDAATGDTMTLAYRFEPGGLQFTTPASFTVSDIPATEHHTPAQAFLQSGTDAPLLLDTDTVYDNDRKTATVTVALPHFSFFYIKIGTTGGATATSRNVANGLTSVLAPEAVAVGRPFQASGFTSLGANIASSLIRLPA